MTKTILTEALKQAKELNLNLVLLKSNHERNSAYIASLETLEELMEFFNKLDATAKIL